MSPFPRVAYAMLSRYAPDRRPIEVDLSDNTNRWGTHPAALTAIRSAESEDLTRYPPVYADALKEAIATRFDVPVETVTTGCGSDDLLDSAFRAAGEPGERIVFPTPTFSMVEIFARMNGMEPCAVAGTASEDPDRLLAVEPALVYLCRPNNPTGDLAPRERIHELLGKIGSDGPVVIVDEAYADFSDDALLEEAAASDRLVVLRTLSKAYGLAGLRVGFGVGPPEVILELEKSRGPYKVSRLAEKAAVAALRAEDGWVQSVVAEVRAERDRLRQELIGRGWSPLTSHANFVLVPTGTHSCTELTASLREKGVAVRPFPDLQGVGDSIRVSIGPRAEVDRFLSALDQVTS